MDNIEKLVKQHKHNLLKKNDTNKRNCNCRTNNTCPLDGKKKKTLNLLNIYGTQKTKTSLIIE